MLTKAQNYLNIVKCGALGCKEAMYLGEERGSVEGEFKEPKNFAYPKRGQSATVIQNKTCIP